MGQAALLLSTFVARPNGSAGRASHSCSATILFSIVVVACPEPSLRVKRSKAKSSVRCSACIENAILFEKNNILC